MFLVAMLLLLIGIPVAFAFGFASLIFAYLFADIDILALLPFRIYGIMQNFTLIAVPMFIFMGLTLQKSKIAEELLESVGELFGSFRGGLAISVVLVGSLIGATTGIVGASVVMMGLISLPTMLKSNYSKSLATGVITASGTLGQIIPPSIILIILGDVMGISVGDLFKIALIPSLLLISLYIIYIAIYSNIFQDVAPPIKSNRVKSEILKELLLFSSPTLLLIFAVLGSIFFGVASPTEASAIGAFGSIVLTLLNRTFSFEMLKYISIETLKLTSMIFMVLIGASAFSLVFYEIGGSEFLLELFSNELSSKLLFIAISMFLIFILGFFIDFIEITFIVIPILLPIAKALGVDLSWFAILIAINLQASFLTPPFGFAIFFLKGVSSKLVDILDIYRGVIPFILIQLFVILIIIIFPEIIYIFR